MIQNFDMMSMGRSRSMFKDIRQNKNNECKYNQKFTEIVLNLIRMHNDNMIDDGQYKKTLVR